jgi:hypothetical protein
LEGARIRDERDRNRGLHGAVRTLGGAACSPRAAPKVSTKGHTTGTRARTPDRSCTCAKALTEPHPGVRDWLSATRMCMHLHAVQNWALRVGRFSWLQPPPPYAVTPRDACDESPELVATDAVTVRASAEFVRLRLVAPHTLSVLGAAGVPERPSAERSARLIALQKYRSYAVQYGAADQAT